MGFRTTSIHRAPWALLGTAAVLVWLVPEVAHANPIVTRFLFLKGAALFIPSTVFILGVEAFVVRRFLALEMRQALALVVVANVVSALAGVPVVMYYFDWPQGAADVDYFEEMREFLPNRLRAYGAMFAIAVLSELAVAWAFVVFRGRAVRRVCVVLAVLVANAATYVVLCPVEYVLSAPPLGGNLRWPEPAWMAYKDDEEVRQKVTEPYLYVDPNRNLCVAEDGKMLGGEGVAEGELASVCFTPDLRYMALTLESSAGFGRHVWHQWLDRRSGRQVRLPRARGTVRALSPSGLRVAGRGCVGGDDALVWLFDAASEAFTSCTVPDTEVSWGIVWSHDDDVLYAGRLWDVEKPPDLYRIDVDKDFGCHVTTVTTWRGVNLCTNYGPRHLAHTTYTANPRKLEHRETEVDRAGQRVLDFALARRPWWQLTADYSMDWMSDRSSMIPSVPATAIEVREAGVPLISLDTRRPLHGGAFLRKGEIALIHAGDYLYAVDVEEKRMAVLQMRIQQFFVAKLSRFEDRGLWLAKQLRERDARTSGTVAAASAASGD